MVKLCCDLMYSTCKLLAHLIAGDPNSLLWCTAWSAVASHAFAVRDGSTCQSSLLCTFATLSLVSHNVLRALIRGTALHACVHAGDVWRHFCRGLRIAAARHAAGENCLLRKIVCRSVLKFFTCAVCACST